MLDTDPSCRKAVARVSSLLVAAGSTPCSEDTAAYCKARKRLPPGVLPGLTRQVAAREEARVAPEHRWRDLYVVIVDGSSVSMPDTLANQSAFPQPNAQAPGCGFPVARIAALFSWSSGVVLDAALDSLHVHERTLFHQIWGAVKPGSLVMGDRGFCSYGDIAYLKAHGAETIFRMHQSKLYDFRKGQRLGPEDHLVIWQKGVRPRGMSQAEYDGLPDEMVLRELRFRIEIPGFRTREIVVVTTLLDPVAYPKEAIAALYRDRWICELNLRHLKITLQMDVLRGKTPDIVRKEFWAHLLAYNLLRGVMAQAVDRDYSRAHRLSVRGTQQRYDSATGHMATASPATRELLYQNLLRQIAADPVPDRPDRIEPRTRKHRPKNYRLLTCPRAEARRKLIA